jgi:hypothetical protein|tara:strand:- start:194 stop:775 length:582 start_codon:yes stop_codon:yes gene_type:complete
MAKLDPDVIAALKKQAPKVAKKDIRKEVDKRFKKLKQQMISEFLDHPITKEILGGPEASNTSGTLNGISNLFAFIGFSKGDQPILPILDLLEKTQIVFKKDSKGRFIGSEFEITMPTKEQIFAVTPLPYVSGRSWAEGIERGISGLGFLLRKNAGRSGAAIQTRVKVRKGRFQNVPYISSFLSKYIKKIKELK